MGILRLHRNLIKDEPELVSSTLYWLRHECKAEIKYAVPVKEYYEYHIEGEDIPEGDKYFWVEIIPIVNGVNSVRIFKHELSK